MCPRARRRAAPCNRRAYYFPSKPYQPKIFSMLISIIADPGCLSRIRIFSIPDPNFSHPGSRIHNKEFKYFNPKKCFKALGIMIRVVHPGSGSRILIFYLSHYPGAKKAPDPGSGSATLVPGTYNSLQMYRYRYIMVSVADQ